MTNVTHGRCRSILPVESGYTPDVSTKISKTDAEWRAELTPEQYDILRGKGTERPFTGQHGECRATVGQQLLHAPHGGPLPELRFAPGARVRRWTRPDGPALLHQFGGTRPEARGAGLLDRPPHLDPGDLAVSRMAVLGDDRVAELFVEVEIGRKLKANADSNPRVSLGVGVAVRPHHQRPTDTLALE